MNNQQKNSPIDRLIIGLTGGIGSGKTVVSDWFAQRGVDIVDADVIAHQVVAKGSPTLQILADQFGDWIIDPDGSLNRAKLRTHVFDHPNALKELENITHPAIREQAYQQLLHSTSDYVIISAPLLLEASKAGLASLCDRVLVVDVPEKLQWQRASQRDGQTVEKIQAIMNNQLNREDRLAQATDVVVNDGTLAQLYDKLPTLHQQFLDMSH